MSIVQKIVSLILYTGHSSKKVSFRYNYVVCMGGVRSKDVSSASMQLFTTVK